MFSDVFQQVTTWTTCLLNRIEHGNLYAFNFKTVESAATFNIHKYIHK